MLEAPEQPAANMAYDVERNMPELFWFLEDCRERGIPVSLLDNAYVNGGEVQLLRVLDRRGWLLDLAGYSGWNTSANSLGTAIAQGVRYLYHGPTPASRNFLVERYIEDVGYGAVVRGKVTWEQLPALGMNYFDAKEQRGEAAALVRQGLEEFVQREMGSIASQVTVEDLYLPWSRMFEIGLTARWNG